MSLPPWDAQIQMLVPQVGWPSGRACLHPSNGRRRCPFGRRIPGDGSRQTAQVRPRVPRSKRGTGLAVREPKHRVGGQTRHEVERAQRLGHPVHLQGQGKPVDAFSRVVLDADLKRRRLVGQGEASNQMESIHTLGTSFAVTGSTCQATDVSGAFMVRGSCVLFCKSVIQKARWRGALRSAEGVHAPLHHRFKRGGVMGELRGRDAL